jgi:uncharacterized protein YdiU (UPF0061 family)
MVKYNMSSNLFKKWTKEYNNRSTNKADAIKQVKVFTPKVAPVKPEQSKEDDDMEVVDNFFASLSDYITKMKDTERQRDEYKSKCEKWAKQVVELQNILVNKG